MKQHKRIKMKLKATRAHFVLFHKDSPFKQKVVKNKLAYNRKPKHKGRDL